MLEKQTHLDGEVTSVDIVSEEEVPRIGRVAADFEELHQIKLRPAEKRWEISAVLPSTPSRILVAESLGRGRRTHILTVDVAADWWKRKVEAPLKSQRFGRRASKGLSPNTRFSAQEGPTGDGSIDLEEVGLFAEDLGRLREDEQGLRWQGGEPSSAHPIPPLPYSRATNRDVSAHLLIGEATFAVKVVLEEGNVGFGPGRVAVKLFVGRFLGRAGLDVFDDAFLSRERVALVVGVDGKVDRGEAGAAVLDGADGRLCLETALVRHVLMVQSQGRLLVVSLDVDGACCLQVGGGQ